MPRYFNIDRYGRQKFGLISIYIFVFDTNTTQQYLGQPLIPENVCAVLLSGLDQKPFMVHSPKSAAKPSFDVSVKI